MRPLVLAGLLSTLATGCASTPPAPRRPAAESPAPVRPARNPALDTALDAFHRGDFAAARPGVADAVRRAPRQTLTIAASDVLALLEEHARQAAQLQAQTAQLQTLRQELRDTQKALAEKEDALRRVTATVVGPPR